MAMKMIAQVSGLRFFYSPKDDLVAEVYFSKFKVRIQTILNVHENNNTKDTNTNEILDSWGFKMLAALDKKVEEQDLK